MSTYRKYKTKGLDADPDPTGRQTMPTTVIGNPGEVFQSYLLCGFPKEIVDTNLDGKYELPPSKVPDGFGAARSPVTYNTKPKVHNPTEGMPGAN